MFLFFLNPEIEFFFLQTIVLLQEDRVVFQLRRKEKKKKTKGVTLLFNLFDDNDDCNFIVHTSELRKDFF